MTDADQSRPRGGAGDRDGVNRDADLEQWGRYAKPLGVFDESRSNEFLNITVARGEAVDALTVLCREARDERDQWARTAQEHGAEAMRQAEAAQAWRQEAEAHSHDGEADAEKLRARVAELEGTVGKMRPATDSVINAAIGKRWLASEYLDNGEWGILTEDNEIIVRIRVGFTKELARHVAEAHNASLTQGHSTPPAAPRAPHGEDSGGGTPIASAATSAGYGAQGCCNSGDTIPTGCGVRGVGILPVEPAFREIAKRHLISRPRGDGTGRSSTAWRARKRCTSPASPTVPSA